MRNIRRNRNRCLAFCIAPATAAIVAIVAINRIHPPVALQVLQGLLACAALLLGVGGVGGLIHFQGAMRGQDQLRAGKDVIARWTVPPEVWQKFLALDATISAHSVNPITQDLPPLRGPVEVVFGKTSVMVGDDFESLTRSGGLQSISWLDQPLPYLSFNFLVPDEPTPSIWAVRVPVSPGAVSLARAVHQHYISMLAK